MRISDWSSDVCSSDLIYAHQRTHGASYAGAGGGDVEALSRDRENAFRGKAAACLRYRSGGRASAAALTALAARSEEHTSELQSLMRISYAVFCLKKKQY